MDNVNMLKIIKEDLTRDLRLITGTKDRFDIENEIYIIEDYIKSFPNATKKETQKLEVVIKHRKKTLTNRILSIDTQLLMLKILVDDKGGK